MKTAKELLNRAVNALVLRADYKKNRADKADVLRLTRRAHELLTTARNIIDPRQNLGVLDLCDAFVQIAPRHGIQLAVWLYAIEHHPEHFGVEKITTPIRLAATPDVVMETAGVS